MKILFLIDSMERHRFYLRLTTPLQNKHKIFFATTEPLAAISAKLKGIQTLYLTKKNVPLKNFSKEEITCAAKTSIEPLTGKCTHKTAERLIIKYSESIVTLIKKEKINKVIIWNGQQLLGRAATLAVKHCSTDTQYLEISNLPGKIFSDKLGVNALSSIAKDTSILDAFQSVESSMHNKWMIEYEKAKQRPLPQAQRRLKHRLEGAANLLLKFALRETSLKEVTKKVGSRTSPEKHIHKKLNSANLPSKYIFLPLQVSSDTQIKLHSDIDNAGAIEYAHNYASALKIPLLVKLHPAETSTHEIKKIIDLQHKFDFQISIKNTNYLIKNAQSVITINSTAGLESMLYEKHVITLGRCFYRDFDQERLKKYVHRYLIDGIEYFESCPIELQKAESLLNN